ncbi:MAG TPA: Fic family protein [Acidobacteriota bacterium]|nr:Fic family protein [Acidobacteriota bacterium]
MIPTTAAWQLADLGEARGKQELFVRQSPQKLKALKEHALIESAISSNRIEGIEVDRARIGTLIFGKPPLQDRNEEEVRGYRDALKMIHERASDLAVSVKTLLELHSLCRGGVPDAGNFKEKQGDIIEKFADGRTRVRFRTVSPDLTPSFVQELVSLWARCREEGAVHALIVLAAFNLDFLCIHPFRDGNGRVSRLLLLLQCYHLGYEVGRYISLEGLIEENKERYYETLELSSEGWHEGKHDPWPYINFVLFIIKSAYWEFEERLQQTKSPRGAKTQLAEAAVGNFPGAFSLSQIKDACPGVSRDMIRRVLRNLQAAKKVECLSRGPGATWRKKR